MPHSLGSRKEVFLSHSDKDRKFVVRLARVLTRHSVRYWYSATHIAAAQQWHDEIGRALARCDWFLVILTPDSVRSRWVKHELLFAFNNSRYKQRIIPLLLKNCNHSQLSWTLAGFQFVDFRGDFDAGCRQLLRVWAVRYNPAPEKPGRKMTAKRGKKH